MSDGSERFDVRYRTGGGGTSDSHGGTFKEREHAEHRRKLILTQIAAGAPVTPHSNLPAPVAYRWLYFVRMGVDGPIKIGTAIDVDRRIRQMQTANPYPLALIAKIPWQDGEEERVQASFRHAQMVGEWFRPVPELLAYIASVAPEWHVEVRP